MTNYYGSIARRHWERWLPQQYAAIEDPEAFFTDMGNRASDRIDDLADRFAGESPPGERGIPEAGGPAGGQCGGRRRRSSCTR